MLQVNDIHTWYGDSYILQGVSLEVKDGTVVALLGPQRHGQDHDHPLHHGAHPAAQGQHPFNGHELVGMPTHKIARLGIGLIPQGRLIFSVAVGGREPQDGRPHRRARRTPGPWTRCSRCSPSWPSGARTRGTCLSGGEQQMLTIARALMTNPDLLLFDEPSEGLAPVVVDEVFRVIRELKAAGRVHPAGGAGLRHGHERRRLRVHHEQGHGRLRV